MVTDAVKSFKPKFFILPHGDTDLSKFTDLMKGTDDIEIALGK
jgi:hypothetical protein